MSSSMQTKLDRGTVDDTTRADAAAFLIRTGNADVLEILGLPEPVLEVDPDQPPADPKPDPPAVRAPLRLPHGAKCPNCANPVPRTGVCRRGKRCKEAAGPAANKASVVELSCDRPGCGQTALGRGAADARVSAELAGWLVDDKNGQDWCGQHRPDGEAGAP